MIDKIIQQISRIHWSEQHSKKCRNRKKIRFDFVCREAEKSDGCWRCGGSESVREKIYRGNKSTKSARAEQKPPRYLNFMYFDFIHEFFIFQPAHEKYIRAACYLCSYERCRLLVANKESSISSRKVQHCKTFSVVHFCYLLVSLMCSMISSSSPANNSLQCQIWVWFAWKLRKMETLNEYWRRANWDVSWTIWVSQAEYTNFE